MDILVPYYSALLVLLVILAPPMLVRVLSRKRKAVAGSPFLLFGAIFLIIFYVGLTSLSTVGSAPTASFPSPLLLFGAVFLAGFWLYRQFGGRK